MQQRRLPSPPLGQSDDRPQLQSRPALATEQGGEQRIARDGVFYTWEQFLRHYGPANALARWQEARALPLAPGHAGGTCSSSTCPDDVDTAAWGTYALLTMFARAYVGQRLPVDEARIAALEAVIQAAEVAVAPGTSDARLDDSTGPHLLRWSNLVMLNKRGEKKLGVHRWKPLVSP
eukprot:11320173-Alexandrium_andersonii.AAC.1